MLLKEMSYPHPPHPAHLGFLDVMRWTAVFYNALTRYLSFTSGLWSATEPADHELKSWEKIRSFPFSVDFPTLLVTVTRSYRIAIHTCMQSETLPPFWIYTYSATGHWCGWGFQLLARLPLWVHQISAKELNGSHARAWEGGEPDGRIKKQFL